MAQRMALYMQDKHPIRYELEMAKYAEVFPKSGKPTPVWRVIVLL